MKRRIYSVLIWTCLAGLFGLLAVRPIFDGKAVDLSYSIVTVLHGITAGFYWMHPEPMDDPDEPAPREWFELAGLIAVVLLGSTLLLFVALG